MAFARGIPTRSDVAEQRHEGQSPNVLTEVGAADFWTTAIEGFRQLGPKSKTMSEAEANGWFDEQLQASKDGVVFGSSTYYACVLRKA